MFILRSKNKTAKDSRIQMVLQMQLSKSRGYRNKVVSQLDYALYQLTLWIYKTNYKINSLFNSVEVIARLLIMKSLSRIANNLFLQTDGIAEFIFYISGHQRCSIIKGVLKIFAKSTGKRLCQSLFFINVAGLNLQQIY